jgi:hypothetical protein
MAGVLQVLARSPAGLKLALVKDYVARQLQADSRCALASACWKASSSPGLLWLLGWGRVPASAP